MCGIVGLFLKNAELQSQLGMHLESMLISMSDRGPDSAGIAIYGSTDAEKLKLTVQSGSTENELSQLQRTLESRFSHAVDFNLIETHAVLQVDKATAESVEEMLRLEFPEVRVMSRGDSVEIYKEVGPPAEVARRFGIAQMDQCLVHNGSLSNHNNLRRELIHQGINFETENDTEVAAAYLSYHIDGGLALGDALEGALNDLDGFYTFVFGTRTGFGVLRDPIACKPAVLAETKDYVAFGSEYRALASLPEIEHARVWEPEPATVYFWEH